MIKAHKNSFFNTITHANSRTLDLPKCFILKQLTHKKFISVHLASAKK